MYSSRDGERLAEWIHNQHTSTIAVAAAGNNSASTVLLPRFLPFGPFFRVDSIFFSLSFLSFHPATWFQFSFFFVLFTTNAYIPEGKVVMLFVRLSVLFLSLVNFIPSSCVLNGTEKNKMIINPCVCVSMGC